MWAFRAGCQQGGPLVLVLRGEGSVRPSLVRYIFSGTPFQVEPWVMGAVIGAIALVFILVVVLVIRAQQLPVNTGREGLIGQTAVVRSPLDPRGTVFIEGEIWNAWMEGGRADQGDEVTVLDVDGLRLKVVKKSK
jgi:membrane-bound serine protease (ClpP class)